MLFKRDYPWIFEYLALSKLCVMSVPQFNKIQHLYLHIRILKMAYLVANLAAQRQTYHNYFCDGGREPRSGLRKPH